METFRSRINVTLTSSLKEFTNGGKALGSFRNLPITSVLHACYVIDDVGCSVVLKLILLVYTSNGQNVLISGLKTLPIIRERP